MPFEDVTPRVLMPSIVAFNRSARSRALVFLDACDRVAIAEVLAAARAGLTLLLGHQCHYADRDIGIEGEPIKFAYQ